MKNIKKLLLALTLGLAITPFAHGMKTNLIEAIRAGDVAQVKQLLAAGVSANETDEYSWSALLWAVEMGHEPIVRLLLAASASVNWGNIRGETALTEAARNGHESIVRLLLDAGASVSLANKYGTTALMLAAENGHEQVWTLLIERLLKIPNEAQKQRIHTTLLSMEKAGYYKDLRKYMKRFLMQTIEEENRGINFENSVAKQEIDKIKNEDIKQRLLARYGKK